MCLFSFNLLLGKPNQELPPVRFSRCLIRGGCDGTVEVSDEQWEVKPPIKGTVMVDGHRQRGTTGLNHILTHHKPARNTR